MRVEIGVANRTAISKEVRSGPQSGVASIELLFCGIFLLLLVAFVVQQVHFALDYTRAGDELRQDLLREARADELNTSPQIIGAKSESVVLRPSPFLTAYIHQDQSKISHTITMTAAGGTKKDDLDGLSFTYGMADNAGWVNIWQLDGGGPLKVAALAAVASGI